MTDFRPASPPVGRLVRLGLVLDPRNDPGQTSRIAEMAEQTGLQSLWVNDRFITADSMIRLEAWTMLSIAVMSTTRIRVGVMFTAGLRSPQAVGAMVGSMDIVAAGRLELGVSTGWYQSEFRGLGLPFPDAATRIGEMGTFATTIQTLCRGEPLSDGGPALGTRSPQPGGPPLTLEARGARQLAIAVEIADNVLLPTRPTEEIEVLIGLGREMCAEKGRDPSTLGFAVQLPVSVGRADAGSDVRVGIDDMLAQMDTRTIGVNADLEHCQEMMIELANLGIDEVRCVLPQDADFNDVITQLTSGAIAPTEPAG